MYRSIRCAHVFTHNLATMNSRLSFINSNTSSIFTSTLRHSISSTTTTSTTTTSCRPRRTRPRCHSAITSSSSSVPIDSSNPSSTPPKTFRLSPSDFAFLWEECKRCFYFKAHGIIHRPRAPFPSIFGTIDLAMKRNFRGLRTTDLLPEMPPGIFLCEEDDAWVESKPITPLNHKHSVFIRGMIDCLVRFDDGTYGVIDFKTSSSSKSSEIYRRQLQAYALALEDPSKGSQLEQCGVSDMGLVVYTPDKFHTPIDDQHKVSAALTGDLTYVHVPRDDASFEQFLSLVLDVLVLPNAPSPPAPRQTRWKQYTSCPYCQYIHEMNKLNL